jgi:hypothetical protein
VRVSYHALLYHLYVNRHEGVKNLWSMARSTWAFMRSTGILGDGSISRAKRVLNFIVDNTDKVLSEDGVKGSDAMSNIRRFENRGLIYVIG